MTNNKFNGSKSLSDNNVTIKNIGKVNVNASLLTVKVLNKKKKKVLTIIFIIIITKILEGDIRKAKQVIKPKIKLKNISFFPYFSLACIMTFNYNRFLWLK